jgi:2'-5' RNA ligase
LSTDRARLFVALELPDAARAGLVAWRSGALGALPGLRALPPEALHVTLCFLGSRDVGEIEPIAAACSSAAHDAPDGLSLGEPAWLPRRRPRVVTVSVQDPRGELATMQASLSETLHAGGWYEPEQRPFLGHVTVARVPRGERMRALELPAPPALSLDGARVTLFRSRLGRGGARYEALG